MVKRSLPQDTATQPTKKVKARKGVIDNADNHDIHLVSHERQQLPPDSPNGPSDSDDPSSVVEARPQPTEEPVVHSSGLTAILGHATVLTPPNPVPETLLKGIIFGTSADIWDSISWKLISANIQFFKGHIQLITKATVSSTFREQAINSVQAKSPLIGDEYRLWLILPSMRHVSTQHKSLRNAVQRLKDFIKWDHQVYSDWMLDAVNLGTFKDPSGGEPVNDDYLDQEPVGIKSAKEGKPTVTRMETLNEEDLLEVEPHHMARYMWQLEQAREYPWDTGSLNHCGRTWIANRGETAIEKHWATTGAWDFYKKYLQRFERDIPDIAAARVRNARKVKGNSGGTSIKSESTEVKPAPSSAHGVEANQTITTSNARSRPSGRAASTRRTIQRPERVVQRFGTLPSAEQRTDDGQSSIEDGAPPTDLSMSSTVADHFSNSSVELRPPVDVYLTTECGADVNSNPDTGEEVEDAAIEFEVKTGLVSQPVQKAEGSTGPKIPNPLAEELTSTIGCPSVLIHPSVFPLENCDDTAINTTSSKLDKRSIEADNSSVSVAPSIAPEAETSSAPNLLIDRKIEFLPDGFLDDFQQAVEKSKATDILQRMDVDHPSAIIATISPLGAGLVGIGVVPYRRAMVKIKLERRTGDSSRKKKTITVDLKIRTLVLALKRYLSSTVDYTSVIVNIDDLACSASEMRSILSAVIVRFASLLRDGDPVDSLLVESAIRSMESAL